VGKFEANVQVLGTSPL